MPRLPTVDPTDLHKDLRAMISHDALADAQSLGSMRIWGNRPDLAMIMVNLRSAVATSTTLPPRLVEVVRLRVAFHNQCRSCMAMRDQGAVDDGLTEELVCELAHPDEATDLTEAERVALEYADLVVTAPQQIDDAIFDRMREHLSAGEIIELGMHIAIFVGFGKVSMSWDLVDELPTGLTREGVVGPWDAEFTLARG